MNVAEKIQHQVADGTVVINTKDQSQSRLCEFNARTQAPQFLAHAELL